MKADHYGSGDFAAVPAQLAPQLPAQLVHKNVLGEHRQSNEAFSRQRSHLVRVVDLPSKVLSMTLGGLEPGQSTRLHRHNYETVIYVLKGRGRSRLEGVSVEWAAGDAFYVPVWAWHQHINTGDDEVLYVACENAPLLQNLGIALRQEGEPPGQG